MELDKLIDELSAAFGVHHAVIAPARLQRVKELIVEYTIKMHLAARAAEILESGNADVQSPSPEGESAEKSGHSLTPQAGDEPGDPL